jgi:hypothetical protein
VGRRKPGEISDVQFARMTEREVSKLLTGRRGTLEVSWPGSDDERIDMETHVKWSFGPRLAIQIKAHSWLETGGQRRSLIFNFDERLDRVHSHPLFWYLLGHFTMDRLAFESPLFLVESERFHREADPRVKGDTIEFQFQASMKPDSHDKWVDCRVEPLHLASRVIEILQQAEARQGLLALPLPPIAPGSLLVGVRQPQ